MTLAEVKDGLLLFFLIFSVLMLTISIFVKATRKGELLNIKPRYLGKLANGDINLEEALANLKLTNGIGQQEK